LSRTPDDLPPIIFNKLADSLAEPLSLIFERSFEDGEIPEVFRQSIVTPVFKKGDRSVPSNYRPIAQGVVPCLVMESIIADRIMDHLLAQNLLDPNQHGFRKGRPLSFWRLPTTGRWQRTIATLFIVYISIFLGHSTAWITSFCY